MLYLFLSMVLAKLSTLQISFIVTVVVVVALLLVGLLYLFYHRMTIKKKFREYDYKKVMSIAESKDYFLINNFLFRVGDNDVANVDHILFADKYIYIINDFYYEGDLGGKENDKSLILYKPNGQKFYTDNPLIFSNKIVTRLSLITGVDKSLMIGIILINDNCQVALENHSKQFYIIQRKRLKALIRAIESRDVGNINATQLEDCVHAISKMNRRNRK